MNFKRHNFLGGCMRIVVLSSLFLFSTQSWAQTPEKPYDPPQQNADSGEPSKKKDDSDSDSEEEEEEKPAPKPETKKPAPKTDAPKPPPKVPNSPQTKDSPQQDGVVGPVEEESADEGVFDKITEVNEKFGVIFRPQLGLTTISGNDETYAGYHAGIHIGYHKSTLHQ